ncbi:MAG: STM3941 family protein [Mucilaginibacter sp.]
MHEIKIYKSKWKALRLILLVLPFVCFASWDIVNNSKIEPEFLNWFCICFFGLGIPLGIFNLLDKRPELILSETGIFDRSSYGIFEKKTNKGFIKWEDITDAYVYEWQNTYRGLKTGKHKYICIVLNNKIQENLKKTNPISTKLAHTLGMGDFVIPLMNLRKFDEQKFVELIKAMAILSASERQKLLSTTSL